MSAFSGGRTEPSDFVGGTDVPRKAVLSGPGGNKAPSRGFVPQKSQEPERDVTTAIKLRPGDAGNPHPGRRPNGDGKFELTWVEGSKSQVPDRGGDSRRRRA